MSDTLLLLSGIPASGKSHFARWLASKKSFVHYDVDFEERDCRLAQDGLLRIWSECVRTLDASSLVEELRRRNRPVVWDWGFPLRCLPIVEAMKRDGFTVWWFDADGSAARKAFEARDDHIATIADFDKQMVHIRADWKRIEQVFSPNILKTLRAGGKRTAPDEIYRKIMDGPTRE